MDSNKILKECIDNGFDVFKHLLKRLREINEDTPEQVREKAIPMLQSCVCVMETLRPAIEIAPSLFPERDIKREFFEMEEFLQQNRTKYHVEGQA